MRGVWVWDWEKVLCWGVIYSKVYGDAIQLDIEDMGSVLMAQTHGSSTVPDTRVIFSLNRLLNGS